MSWSDFLFKLITEPPWIITALISAVLVAHFFRLVLNAATREYPPNIIVILECFLIFILGLLTWYLYEESMSDKKPEHFYDHPITMVFLLILCTFLSIIVYGLFRKFDLLESKAMANHRGDEQMEEEHAKI